METTDKINIRGTIKSLNNVGEKFIFPRNDEYKPSTIRNTASSVRCDTGRWFQVQVTCKQITVKRTK